MRDVWVSELVAWICDLWDLLTLFILWHNSYMTMAITQYINVCFICHSLRRENKGKWICSMLWTKPKWDAKTQWVLVSPLPRATVGGRAHGAEWYLFGKIVVKRKVSLVMIDYIVFSVVVYSPTYHGSGCISYCIADLNDKKSNYMNMHTVSVLIRIFTMSMRV